MRLCGGEVPSVVLRLFSPRPHTATLPCSFAGSYSPEGAFTGCSQLPEFRVVFFSVDSTVVPGRAMKGPP